MGPPTWGLSPRASVSGARTGGKPKCRPSADERIKHLWDTYRMEFYSAVKKKKILPFATAWMDLESIMLS